jgi:hypothetical protein
MKKEHIYKLKKLPIIELMVFSIVALAVMGKTLLPPKGQMLAGEDIRRSVYFQKQFIFTALSHSELPLWNPYLLSGTPFTESPQVDMFYPVNIIFFLFSLPLAYSIFVAFHIVVAMFSSYWLSRRWVGRIPAVAAGLVYGLSGYVAARVWAGHVTVVASYAWVPLVIGVFWQMCFHFEPKKIVIAGLAFALLIVSGYPTIAIFTLWGIGGVAVLAAIKKRSLQPFVACAFAGGISFCLAAVQLLPNQQFLALSIRSKPLPESWVSIWPLDIKHLTELFTPSGFGSLYQPPFYHERAAFVGKVAMFLSLLIFLWSVVKRKTRPEITLAVFLCALGLWISFAQNSGFDLFAVLRHYVPFYKSIRIPTRHMMLFVLGTSMLVGFGTHTLKKWVLQLIICILLIVELVPYATQFITLFPLPETFQDMSIIQTLKKEPVLSRIFPYYNVGEGQRDSFNFNTPNEYQIFSATAYDGAIVSTYYDYMTAVWSHPLNRAFIFDSQVPYGNPVSPYLDAANVKYLLTATDYRDVAALYPAQYRLIHEDAVRQYRLFENRAVMPRFYTVPGATFLPNYTAIMEAISAKNTNPKETVLFDSDKDVQRRLRSLDCQINQKGNVDVTTYALNSLKLQVTTPCNTILMTSEVMYPGWSAWVDGKSQPILTGNLTFRALYMPKGTHEVVMKYQPIALYVGAGISVVSLGMCVYILIKRKKV